ncbi:MAG: hypothetical protein LJE97_07160 [Betaproteobacteria bacterium]|jgi:hypothetical protein|nr:hypothetical protein [Betaproteobacteria bacterium]
MAERISARVVVTGEGALLPAYRERVNELLDEDYSGTYRELHTADRLEYDVRGRGGVPFPPFVKASEEFPELEIAVRWENPAIGERGAADIQAGRLKEQATSEVSVESDVEIDIRAGGDGTIVLAVASRERSDGEWIGYALTASQHGFFRIRSEVGAVVLSASDGVAAEWAERWRVAADDVTYRELEPREPIDAQLLGELDRLAADFASGWIWFSAAGPDETAVERHRYELYSLKVNDANLRAERLRRMMQPELGGYAYSSVGDAGARVVALVARHWLGESRE